MRTFIKPACWISAPSLSSRSQLKRKVSAKLESRRSQLQRKVSVKQFWDLGNTNLPRRVAVTGGEQHGRVAAVIGFVKRTPFVDVFLDPIVVPVAAVSPDVAFVGNETAVLVLRADR